MVLESLAAILHYARSIGVTLALEPLHRYSGARNDARRATKQGAQQVEAFLACTS